MHQKFADSLTTCAHAVDVLQDGWQSAVRASISRGPRTPAISREVLIRERKFRKIITQKWVSDCTLEKHFINCKRRKAICRLWICKALAVAEDVRVDNKIGFKKRQSLSLNLYKAYAKSGNKLIWITTGTAVSAICCTLAMDYSSAVQPSFLREKYHEELSRKLPGTKNINNIHFVLFLI
jgi:hypothetical protein